MSQRERYWMRIGLEGCLDPGKAFDATLARLEHAPALGELMDRAYRGTIDHEGETPEQCLEEMRGTLQGKYGPLIEPASFVCLEGGVATSASLVTYWRELPLLAYSMTDPRYQGQGRGGFLIRRSMHGLGRAGYRELYLVVTEGNAPAEHLYRKLGFELLGPAIPGRRRDE